MNILLSHTEIKELVSNKYLCKQSFDTKTRIKTKSNIKLRENKIFETSESIQIVFLSQVEQITINSYKEKTILETHFSVPVGLLSVVEQNKKSLFENKNDDYLTDNAFLVFRASLIHSFLQIYEADIKTLEKWFSFIKNNEKSELFITIIKTISQNGEVPKVPLSAKFAKATKEELQFIWFGQNLGKFYFADNNNKLDDTHRKWLHDLNPTKNYTIENLPNNFLKDREFIISYLLFIKFKRDNIEFSYPIIENMVTEIIKIQDIDFTNIIFWLFIFDGTNKHKYNYYFSSSFSAQILLNFEIIAYKCLNNKEIETKLLFDIAKLKELKDRKPITTTTNCFKSFAENYVFDSDKLRHITRYEDIQNQKENALIELQKINLIEKQQLIYITDNKNTWSNNLSILQICKKIENVLIIFKLEKQIDQDSNLSTEIGKNQLIKDLKRRYNGISFKVILKDNSDKDDREIKNNIKAFVNQFENKSELLFISDSNNKKQKNRENNWLLNSLSDIPIFDETENYIFAYR